MGTPTYMAPEQARARWDEVDARTDIWAVGATMFKLLTGRVVHVADTVNEQLLAAMTQPAPPIGSLAPTVPIPVVEVVDKALAFNREDRWQDARSMQKAIREAYRAVAGDAPASVRLSFEDDGSFVHADTVAASSKSPTSLTAAHDSAAFPASRRPRRRSRVGVLLTLAALGAAGYYVATRTKVELPKALQLDADGGVLGSSAISIPSAIARIEQALPSAVPPTAESAIPGRTEGPGNTAGLRNDPLVADPLAASAAPAPVPLTAAASSASGDSTESSEVTHAAEPATSPSAPSVTAASSPAPQPRSAAPEKAAPKKAPPPPPKKHTHHHRR
jgi:serine/threonine-protein kinase